MQILPIIKSSLKRIKTITKPITLIENVVIGAAGRNLPLVKLHDSFTLKLDLPPGAFTHQTLHQKFFINHNLGFPAQFMVSLPNVTVLGTKGLVALDDDTYLVEGNWRARNVLGHPGVHTRFKRTKKYLAGDWYSIQSYWSNSYHHWFWDDLPRLLTAIPYLPHDTQFLVGEPFREFQRESLLALGISVKKTKVHSSNNDFNVERLWFATPLGHSEWAATAPDVAKQLQAIFNPNPHPSPFRKIYISRSLARYRRLVNEPDLIPILESFGFELIHAENLSFESQVKLFNEAKVILSSHGAGLTNMLFAPKSTLILELFEPRAARTHYWMMAHALGHNYDCLVGETDDKTNQINNDPDFTIVPGKLHDFIHSNLKKVC